MEVKLLIYKGGWMMFYESEKKSIYISSSGAYVWYSHNSCRNRWDYDSRTDMEFVDIVKKLRQ